MSIGKMIGLTVALTFGKKFFVRNSPDNCLTAILFHTFKFERETLRIARERLKFQCDWLRKNFNPMTLAAATKGLQESVFPKRPLLITIDDAHLDILDVIDIFKSFELPIAIFVCAGWTANASQRSDDTVLAGLVSDLEWYSGPEMEMSFPCGSLKVQWDKRCRRETINDLLKNRERWQPYLEQVVQELKSRRSIGQRNFCSWQELIELRHLGVEIGCHSVSHMNLAEADELRLEFEVFEAKRILIEKFAECEVFAYPFGGPGSFSPRTSDILKQAGFRYAFLTHSDFMSGKEDPHELPRIPLPNRPLSLAEFRARVNGGGVVIANARHFIRHSSTNQTNRLHKQSSA